MNAGFHGLTYPRPAIMARLLLSPRLGLFVLAPILFFAPFGLFLLSKRASARSLALGAAAVAVYFWLFNASFEAWDGGWCYGPRYMVAAIPVLCVGLAPLWSHARTAWRVCLALLTTCGIGFSLIAVSTTMMQPHVYRWPLFAVNWPAFWSGRLPLPYEVLLPKPEVVDPRHAAFNLGQLIGLRGLASLWPLLVVWVACINSLIRLVNPTRRPSSLVAR